MGVTVAGSGSIMEPMERPNETSPAISVSRQVSQEPERCELCGLKPVVGSARRATRLVAESPAMREVLLRAGRFAQAEAPVVITGESGTGKEVVARALHASSLRADKPFVAVNVAALPAELLESELFGHARGAFTGAHAAHQGLFEAAGGGVLFLDEIGDMPLELQAKMLRALQDGEIRRLGDTRPFAVDVRIICATHRDLADLVTRGAFREDLFYRISVLTLKVPSLRERREDILALSRQLLESASSPHTLAQDAAAALLAHAWPGNVRELDNVLRHGAALATGAVITRANLPDNLGPRPQGPEPSVPMCTLAESERAHVLGVLGACKGSVVEAARVLGIGRNTLWRKLKLWE